MKLRTLVGFLHSADLLIMVFGAFLSVLNALFSREIPHWWIMILVNCGATAAILLLAWLRSVTGWRVLAFVHDWYPAPLVFFTFKELYFIIRPMHHYQDMDDVLIAIDRWLFGVDPTVWLMRYAHPLLTEILQIAYTTFYFLFFLIGFELYRRDSRGAFHFFMFTCVYGFFLSYIGYLFVPAVGPRFTLHDFAALDQELPGILFTPYLRWFVNAGESVPMGVPNALAYAAAQRDVFPSGHTMMMLIMMYFALRYRIASRWGIVGIGTLLILATVYQRYHYVIDLIGGAFFMLLCLTTAPLLFSSLLSRFHTTDEPFARDDARS